MAGKRSTRPSRISKRAPWRGHSIANPSSSLSLSSSGGNDTLNSFIPYNDSLYPSVQPTLHIDTDKVIPLDDEIALTPALAPLKALWDSGKMALIQGVGYPNPNLSHFTSMANWMSGRPGTLPTSGWMGRWLDNYLAGSRDQRAHGGFIGIPAGFVGQDDGHAGFDPGAGLHVVHVVAEAPEIGVHVPPRLAAAPGRHHLGRLRCH